MRRGRTSPSAPNALRCPEKAPKALKCETLTASLQLTMAFAACREWLHSAVFRPEMQLMQLLQLFAYKKTERHPGDTWGNHRPPCLHRKEIANDYINYINYIYCLKMASFRRFRAFPLTAIRTAATAFLQLTSSSRLGVLKSPSRGYEKDGMPRRMKTAPAEGNDKKIRRGGRVPGENIRSKKHRSWVKSTRPDEGSGDDAAHGSVRRNERARSCRSLRPRWI